MASARKALKAPDRCVLTSGMPEAASFGEPFKESIQTSCHAFAVSQSLLAGSHTPCLPSTLRPEATSTPLHTKNAGMRLGGLEAREAQVGGGGGGAPSTEEVHCDVHCRCASRCTWCCTLLCIACLAETSMFAPRLEVQRELEPAMGSQGRG